jgi:hypothetical protein
MSDDRKYRQRGYQDSSRERQPKPAAPRPAPEPGAPAGARRLSSQDGPKTINMPGYREVVRCAQCGAVVQGEVAADTQCPRCGTDLHACGQCTSFDPGSRLECMQTTLTVRITPKNTRNSCALYTPRTTVERETTSPKPDTARSAFDDLFNF